MHKLLDSDTTALLQRGCPEVNFVNALHVIMLCRTAASAMCQSHASRMYKLPIFDTFAYPYAGPLHSTHLLR